MKSATATIIDLNSKSFGRMAKLEKLDRDVVKWNLRLDSSLVKCTLEAGGVGVLGRPGRGFVWMTFPYQNPLRDFDGFGCFPLLFWS